MTTAIRTVSAVLAMLVWRLAWVWSGPQNQAPDYGHYLVRGLCMTALFFGLPAAFLWVVGSVLKGLEARRSTSRGR